MRWNRQYGGEGEKEGELSPGSSWPVHFRLLGQWSFQPLSDRHPGEKACGTGLLSGPQGAVLQNLWEVGALAPNYLQPEAVACTLVSSPSLHNIPSPMFSPPGAKLLITIIPHASLLTLHKSSGSSIISCCPSQKTGIQQNETFPLIPPPPFYNKETEDQAGNGP